MKIGSLFSGIGGLDMAIEAHGYEVAWQVEYDDFCNKVLGKHWPEVTRYGDIRTTDFAAVERVDGIIGGFPCQPFSVAGRNRGEDDERNMWPDTIRVIRELRPGFAFLENVPGLLAHRYYGRILGDLAEAGYDAEWDTFKASDVGAPHRRERLFILAYTRDGQLPESERGQEARDGLASDGPLYVAHTIDGGDGRRVSVSGRDCSSAPNGEAPRSGAALVDAHGDGFRAHNATEETECEWRPKASIATNGFSFPPAPDDLDGWAYMLSEMPSLEPALCRVADGVPDRAHRLKALGNAVVWPQAALAFEELSRRAASPVL